MTNESKMSQGKLGKSLASKSWSNRRTLSRARGGWEVGLATRENMHQRGWTKAFLRLVLGQARVAGLCRKVAEGEEQEQDFQRNL
jgi:hypothetical protein